jgi:hypothetical protein
MNTCTEGQPFGGNYDPLYRGIGLVGHPGQDWSCGWGSDITSRYAGLAYKVYSFEDTPNEDGFTEVDLIVDDGLECFEWQVGHLNPTIAPGIQVQVGGVIGTEANHGPVYAGNVQITVPMQKAGDQRGHHRHFQKRPIFKTKYPGSNQVLLGQDGRPYQDAQGSFYQVFDFENGYHGCVDPTLPVFHRQLSIGMSGYDVWVMQRILTQGGFFTATPSGYFGSVTEAALMNYQASKGLDMVGVAGPATRAALSQALQPLPDLSGN